ncbi:MAG: DUF4270 family protein [Flavobacteriaceae bacterium]
MTTYRLHHFGAVIALVLLVVFSACEKDTYTLGQSVIEGEPFNTNRIEYPIESIKQLKVDRVQTSQLPIFQLGNFNDPIFGTTNSQILTQVQLTEAKPIFGRLSADTEGLEDLSGNNDTLNENETVVRARLYIPFQKVPAASQDSDSDGVQDAFDVDPNDINSDSDGDGLTDNEERLRGTDPLNADTDGDGINDLDDESTASNSYAKRVALDSIYSFSESKVYDLTVRHSDFFLRNHEPTSGFLDPSAYFSDDSSKFEDFLGVTLYQGRDTISEFQYIEYQIDDPDTEEDESAFTDASKTKDPGIYIDLDPQFFQTMILDKEGGSELLSRSNFKDHFRGIHLSLATDNDIMMLFNLTSGYIEVDYTNDFWNTQGDSDESNDAIDTEERSFRLNLVSGGSFGITSGNAVNTWTAENSVSVVDNQDFVERVYLKGGSGYLAQFQIPDEIIDEIKTNNWLVNEANIVFHVDQDVMQQYPQQPSRLYLFKEGSNLPVYDAMTETSEDETPLGIFLNYDGILQYDTEGEGSHYTVRLTDYLNHIVLRDSVNVPINVAVSANIGLPLTYAAKVSDSDEVISYPQMSAATPLGTVLYGSNNSVPEDKRLELKIFYTEIQN